jgi:hypothetical protein
MYDTVNLWLETPDADKALARCDNHSEHIKPLTGEFYTTARLANLRVKAFPRGLSIQGSWSKFTDGNNLELPTRNNAPEAIGRLSDALSLPMENATDTRADIGANLELSNPVRNYLAMLGHAQYFRQTIYDVNKRNNLLYRSSDRQLNLYDKLVEMKSRKEPIPDCFRGRNILRYELRYLQRLPKRFKMPRVFASDLANPQFFANLVGRWEQAYFSIEQQSLLAISSDANITGMRTLKDFLAAKGIEAIGGKLAVMDLLRYSQRNGELSNMQFSRSRSLITELCSKPTFLTESKAILELDAAVRDTASTVLQSI